MRKIDPNPIYMSLLNYILTDGQNLQDGRLPTESELAQHYGIARNTLRPVLKRLEQEGYVTRCQKSGTRITRQQEKPVIYFLLPCPDFLEAKHADHAAFSLHMLSKVSREAYEYGASLKLLYATDNNEYGRINFDNLEELRPKDRIIVNSSWYIPLLPFLLKRGVRAVYIGPTTEETGQILSSDYQALFHFLLLDAEKDSYDLYRLLRSRGAQRIALLGRYIQEDNPITLGFLQACREAGGEEAMIFRIPIDTQASSSVLAQKLMHIKHILLTREDVDAVMLTDLFPEDIHPLIRELAANQTPLPHIAFPKLFGDEIPQPYHCTISQTSIAQASKRAVQLLLAPTWQPGIDYLTPQYITE